MTSVVIPIFRPQKPDDFKIELPDISANLFNRIIRDPTAPDRPARERRCAEMLCALLLNCDSLREHVLKSLAVHCGWDDVPVADLEFEIETETAIGRKRDDLRIEGFLYDGNVRRRVVLWTIEVKVQAGLHYSSHQDFSVDEESESEAEVVAQLENYDRWLQTQDAEYKAGVVVSITSMESEVGKLGLRETWVCIRWTDLGRWVETYLASDRLRETEALVAKHFVSFAWHYLWDDTDMTSERFGIDDLALVRAIAVGGQACKKRINSLAESLMQTFEESGIVFHGKLKHETKPFGSFLRSVIYGGLLPRVDVYPSPSLVVMAGIEKDKAMLRIESSTRSPWKSRIRETWLKNREDLTARNPEWQFFPNEATNWRDVVLEKPLVWLLTEEDQAAALQQFVAKGIEDLRDCGLIEALQALADEAEA